MSSFNCPVVKLKIETHPNADRLSIAIVDGYKCIVLKDEFKTGDLAVYIPEQATVPDWLIEKMGLKGRLAGKRQNRVKAIRLRGIFSQGLICPLSYLPGSEKLKLGDDCSELLGIVKYEPPVPAKLSGDVWNAGEQRTIRYDVENIKKYPRLFVDGEDVVFAEKLHGTFSLFALLPPELFDDENAPDGFLVASKGRADKGLGIKFPIEGRSLTLQEKAQLLYWRALAKIQRKILRRNPSKPVHRNIERLIKIKKGRNVNNVYWRAAVSKNVKECMQKLPWAYQKPCFVLGEVIGKGIQDLDYGADSSKDETLGLYVFDIYVGYPRGEGRFLDDLELSEMCEKIGLPRVPILYRGPFSQKVLEQYTNGKETVSGKKKHVREGIVIRPQKERFESKLGRLQLKSVSEKYLLRKGETTEYN